MSPLIPYLALSLASAQPGFCGNQYQNSSSPKQVTSQIANQVSDVTKHSCAYGQFQMVLPLEETIEVCRKELSAADFSVLQLGQRRLLGCRKGSTTSFILLTLEQSSAQCTDVMCVFHN